MPAIVDSTVLPGIEGLKEQMEQLSLSSHNPNISKDYSALSTFSQTSSSVQHLTMKLSTTILALAASSVAAHRLGGSPPAAANDTAPIIVERTMQIEFDGGFKGLCEPEVMAKINAVALSTVNDIMREGQDDAFQFETVTVKSQSLAAVAPHHGVDDGRKLRNWDWVSYWPAHSQLCNN